ncbi:T9SS type A sorting domain-containing protein [Bacteroidota bacterium]
MKQLFTTLLMMLVLGTAIVNAQQTREYSSDQVATLLQDLMDATDGDEFVLTTPGDQGYYRIDSTTMEVHADITIRSAVGLTTRPMVKLVYNQEYKDAVDTSMVDYLVRLKADTCELTLYGIELQGDSAKTKYAIRTMKLKDATGDDSYKDPAWDEDSIVQRYVMNIDNCDINGITSGSDGRAIILYVGTRGVLNIKNSTFSEINRDGINMYSDGTRTTANGPFQYVDSIVIMNSTFNNIGREAINYRNSGEDKNDPANKSWLSKIIIEHSTFNDCGNNAADDSYYPMRVDAPEMHITNSLFTNMDQKSYIIGQNRNPKSVVDYVEFFAVLKEGSAFSDIYDAVDFLRDKNGDNDTLGIGENAWLDMHDPKFADAANGDFTLGADSEVLTLASDGLALGDLRWSPGFVATNDATLGIITVDGVAIDNFDPATLTYDAKVPGGTTQVVVAAEGIHPDAVVEVTQATSIPGLASITVTSADGWEMLTYEILFTIEVKVEEDLFNTMRIYPNPASDHFTVENCEGANLSIYSITGQEVYKKAKIANHEIISSDFAKGVYLIQIELNGDRTASKLVIR